MDYFKLLNLERSGSAPFIISESGLKLLKQEPNFDKKFNIMGQCDQSGSLLQDISRDNFSKEPVNVPDVFLPKKEVPSQSKDNGRPTKTAGNTSRGEAKKKAGPKSGSSGADEDDGLTEVNANPQ